MSAKRVVLVGHCGPDSYMLRSVIRAAAPEAEIESADDEAALARVGSSAGLILVNRVLLGSFADSNGIALVGRLSSAGASVMLVSNYPDAQAEAERAGALPGFGKTTMYAPETQQRIREALA